MIKAYTGLNWEMVGITEGDITEIYYELNYVPQISYVEALNPM